MNSLERFLATLDRRPVDRPCTWLGIPHPASLPKLLDYFGVAGLRDLGEALDDDLFAVELPYHSPTSDAIYMAFDFRKASDRSKLTNEQRTLNSPGFFEGIRDPRRVDDFDWPDPVKFIDPAECRGAALEVPPGRVALGVIWSAHFQDACAAFGLQDAFMAMLEAPEMFQAVIDRIADFYLAANEIFYEASRGRLHAVLIGNDFGSQRGLMLSPELIRRHVLPGTRRLVEQARSHGVRVIHHSCGSIRDIIPDLIDCGVSAIHPVQAQAAGHDPAGLRRDFGSRVAFCGAVDTQELLVRGTPEQVREKVRDLRRIFSTGLIISPSHEAILPDVPPENIEAMMQAAHELY